MTTTQSNKPFDRYIRGLERVCGKGGGGTEPAKKKREGNDEGRKETVGDRGQVVTSRTASVARLTRNGAHLSLSALLCTEQQKRR